MTIAATVRDARRAVHQLLGAAREPALLVWALYLLTVPVYIFKSGVPQPGDWLIVLLAPLVLRRQRPAPITLSVRRTLFAFTIYVVSINLIWSIVLGNFSFAAKDGFLLSPFFYVYNMLIFIITVALYQRYRERFLWFTAKTVLCSLLIQVAVSALKVAPGLRTLVLFNNANQLGFYALISASLLMMLQRSAYVSTLEVTIGSLCAVYLCFLSASKAALGGIGLLAVFALFVRLRTMLVVGVAMALSLVVASPMLDAINRSISRIENDTYAVSAIEERGYDRIVNNPEYLVTGAGEGAYRRFVDTTVIGSHEIHSSLGTLLFCYGIVGLILFAVFVWIVLRGSGARMWFLVAPSFAYSMSHQGLRATLFWVMLATVFAIRWEKLARARAAKPSLGALTHHLRNRPACR